MRRTVQFATGVGSVSAGVISSALSEDQARKELGSPFDLTKIDKTDVESAIRRSWWDLAKEVIIAGHDQKADFSFTVRDTVRDIKKNADELVRTLDPNYAKPVQVSPAFQYAQNLTDFNILLKYTARWNAPGAIDVGDINVNFTKTGFSFTGLGTHSNRKYLYNLDLDLFDNIDPELSRWDAGSVGKLLITLRKRWPRKWPRLLKSKKQKISNMHVWMDRQEDFDSSFDKKRTLAASSPLVCADKEDNRLYCLHMDKCVASCDQCEHHKIPSPDENECRGPPVGRPALNWTDTDLTPGKLAGRLSIEAADTYDATEFDVFWSQDGEKQSPENEGGGFLQTVEMGNDMIIHEGTETLPSRSYLVACPKNEFGVGTNCDSVMAEDAALPVFAPVGCEFKDTDKKKKEIGGTIYIEQPEDDTRLEEFAIYYGRSQKGADPERLKGNAAYVSSTKKIEKSSKKNDKRASHYLSSATKLPRGATHFLIYSKNKYGENMEAVACPLVDAFQPISKPAALHMEGRRVTLKQPKESVMKNIKSVVFAWGQPDGCVKDAHIGQIDYNEATQWATTYVIPESIMPPEKSTHLIAKHKNEHGEAVECSSFPISDDWKSGATPSGPGPEPNTEL